MKNSNHEIDNILREKLVNYEEDVSPNFWNRLRNSLYGRKLTNGIVAIIILLFGLTIWVMIPESNNAATINKATANYITATNNRKEALLIESNSTNHENEVQNKSVLKSNEGIHKINSDEQIPTIQKTTKEGKSEINKLVIANDVNSKINTSSNSNFIVPIEPKQVSNISINKYNKFIPEKEPVYSLSANNFNSNSRFSISLEVGYDMSWKNLSSEKEYEIFKQFRVENENPSSNFSYGLQITYQYKNWVISSGLNYTTLSEELNYQITNKLIDPDGGYYDIDTAWAMIYDMEQNLVPMIIGYEITWVDEYKYEVSNVENTNQYNYLEIPISLGYRFNMNKFSICSTAGVSFGFLYSASGNLPQFDSTRFSQLDKNSEYLQKSISNINFALSFEYAITPNYGVYIKPYYKQGLNSIYTNYPLSAKYMNAGVKFGVNIYIN